jgi:hypothetical protein
MAEEGITRRITDLNKLVGLGFDPLTVDEVLQSLDRHGCTS